MINKFNFPSPLENQGDLTGKEYEVSGRLMEFPSPLEDQGVLTDSAILAALIGSWFPSPREDYGGSNVNLVAL